MNERVVPDVTPIRIPIRGVFQRVESDVIRLSALFGAGCICLDQAIFITSLKKFCNYTMFLLDLMNMAITTSHSTY
jgi:hypothetical protein